MKQFFTTILIVLFAINGHAQDKMNVIKATASYGKIFDNTTIRTIDFEYQRNIGLGVFAIISHSRGHGGTPLSQLITEEEFDRLSEFDRIENYEGIGSGFLITFVQSESFGLGVQKNIQLTNEFHFGLSVKGVMTKLSISEMSDPVYDDKGELVFDNLQESFNSWNENGAEVGFHMMYNIKSYAYVGLSIHYLTNPRIKQLGIFSSISF